jgi:hypothetical protein
VVAGVLLIALGSMITLQKMPNGRLADDPLMRIFPHSKAVAGMCILALVLSAGPLAPRATAQSGNAERGWLLYESLQGSSNSLGQIVKWSSTGGYNFNQHFGVDFGVPFYFVRASSSTPGATSANGLGDVYTDLRLTLANPVLNYTSTLTGTAPTGNTQQGFSTGRPTFDWDNYFDRSFGHLTPFVDVGVANTISDTRFFVRPFSTIGLVGHFEGGAQVSVWRIFHVGASAYDVMPTGSQKVYSKLIPRNAAAGGPGGHGRVFASAPVTSGGAAIDRDNGYTAYAGAALTRYLGLEVRYSRSIHYQLDTVSFGVGLNLGSLFRKPQRP